METKQKQPTKTQLQQLNATLNIRRMKLQKQLFTIKNNEQRHFM